MNTIKTYLVKEIKMFSCVWVFVGVHLKQSHSSETEKYLFFFKVCDDKMPIKQLEVFFLTRNDTSRGTFFLSSLITFHESSSRWSKSRVGILSFSRFEGLSSMGNLTLLGKYTFSYTLSSHHAYLVHVFIVSSLAVSFHGVSYFVPWVFQCNVINLIL